MPIRIVQSKQNRRLKQLQRTLAHPLRDAGMDGRLLAAIEGPNLLEEALRANLHIDCIFIAEDCQSQLDALPIDVETEVLLMPRALLAGAMTTETPQPVAALVEPHGWNWAELLPRDFAALVLVLAGLQDPGNLGTIVRSAEAFGATGILCLPGTVSAWNPKAVRASAGSVFRVPMLAATVQECFAHLRTAGIRILTTAVQSPMPAFEAPLAGPVAIIIGNEGNGVSSEVAIHASAAITIPCPGPVESLNAAIAASILLYEAGRQRSSALERMRR